MKKKLSKEPKIIKDEAYWKKLQDELQILNNTDITRRNTNPKIWSRKPKKEKVIIQKPKTKKFKLNKEVSNGERIITRYLKAHNIEYYYDKTFNDLVNPKTNSHLYMDFYLPEYNICIEFNGAQHYKYIPKYHGDDSFRGKILLKNQQFRDGYKRVYCFKKKIRLLTISYTQLEHIEQILEDYIK